MSVSSAADAWQGRRPYSEYGDCPICGKDSCEDHLKEPPVDVESPQPDIRAVPPVAADDEARDVTLDDFHAYMPMHNYIFTPSREVWPAASVNARIPPIVAGKDSKGEPVEIKASTWLDQNRPVEQMTWAPGEPMLIEDRLASEGGWIERCGCRCFNLYRPPSILLGDASQAGPWVELVNRVYPANADHIIQWLAHRRQHPVEKINHALILGGDQGIGKDTILEPAKHAIGPWNFAEVTPAQLLGRFNGFVKSVILRISEARDLGETNRFAFYDHTKVYTASPPDVLRCDEKNLREYSVFNVCGAILTTNHKTDGIYLPAGDRRHYVAWSKLSEEDFTADYWKGIYAWYESGGHAHVAAYLDGLDISSFDPKAPPPKTAAFWDIVDANRAPEDAELADVLDLLGNPDAVILDEIVARADKDLADWIQDRRNNRQLPHRLEEAGYVPVRNDAAKDGKWKVGGRRRVVYARAEMAIRDRIVAAIELVKGARS